MVRPKIGATKVATRAGSLIICWSTTILIAETLRAKATPLTSVISPRGAGIILVVSISFAAFNLYSAD